MSFLLTPIKGALPVTITLTAPVTRQIVQRNGSNQASITVTGTYTPSGSVADIQARVKNMLGFGSVTSSWVSMSPSSGTFSHTMTVSSGYWEVDVQAVNGVGTQIGLASILRVGVGDVFITAGQSLSVNAGQTAQTVNSDNINMRSVIYGWQLANDPQVNDGPTPGSTGSPWPAFANALQAYTGFPVGLVSCGIGNTSSAQWNPSSGTGYYNYIKNALALFPTNGVRAVLWNQGESDASGSVTQASYYNNIKAMIQQSQTDAGWSVPWGIGSPETYESGSLPSQSNIVAAQAQLVTDTYASFYIDMDNNLVVGNRFDGTHLNPTGLTIHGGLWKVAVVSHFSL